MESNTPARAVWSPATRVGFRFACVYWLLYDLPFPISQIPGLTWVQERYDAGWQALVPWVGKHLLRLPTDITVFTNGSGDTTFNYVQVLCFVVLALLGTALWSLLDRRRVQYVVLHDWLRVYLRFVLGATLWGYGMHKVIPLQFGVPSGERLLQTFGDSSPMGLLWTFMAASVPYTIFSGAVEVVAGTLLFFRRTTTLGALLSIAVMANIVALNFCYDVPVKLYSMHLLVHAIFLALPDLSRLVRVFVTHRATSASDVGPPAGPRWLRVTRRVSWVAFVGWIVFSSLAGSLGAREQYGSTASKSALQGVWEVTEFERDGERCALVVGEPDLWRHLAFNAWGSCTIRSTDEKRERVMVELVPDTQKLKFKTIGVGAAEYEFAWSLENVGELLLIGTLRGKNIRARLRTVPDSDFLLRSRGFHWINEFPFNR